MKDHIFPSEYFPLEASVLSSDALADYIKTEYFPSKTITCRLYYRSLHNTYRVTVNQKEYFFKAYRQGKRTKEEIQSEVDLLNFLKEKGLRVSYPVSKQDGTSVCTFHAPDGVCYGVLYESVGVRGFGDIEETAEANEKLGSYFAAVHNTLDQCNFTINRRSLDAGYFIDQPMNQIREFSTVYDFDLVFLEELALNIKKKLVLLPTEKPQYGICHGDFYKDNIRVDEDNYPILFDFDFCGYGWRAYDISLYAFPFGMGYNSANFAAREKRKNQFLNGYNKIRSMNEKEIDSIPLFIPFRRIFNIGTLYISFLQKTWGDQLVIRTVRDDIENLKKWLELNPIF